MKSEKALAKDNLKVMGIEVSVKDIKRKSNSLIYEIDNAAYCMSEVELNDGRIFLYFRNIATNELYEAVYNGEIGYTIGNKY